MASLQPGIDEVIVAGNMTFVCHDPERIGSTGIWLEHNPLNYATPLLLLQLVIITLTSLLIDLCLQPLGQSSIVSKICGGIVFGPSLLGHNNAIASALFPLRGTVVIETIATFGIMFFFFEVGVKTDVSMMLRPGRLAIAMGTSVMFVTLALTTPLSLLLKAYVPMDDSLANSLPLIAASQCLTAFPNIACLLAELKILNTDLGRLAISASCFCDVMGISLMAVTFSIMDTSNLLRSFFAILSTAALLAIIAYVFRPAVLWVHSHTSEGKVVREIYITAIFIAVLVASLVSEIVGQHYILGPLVLGLAVPEGPPLGAALVTKLDSFVSGLLYPTFLTVSGLKTNIFKIHLQSTWIILFIVLFASLAKIGAVLLTAHFTDMPSREALVLGLVLNARGICELAIYILWKDDQILTDQEFTLVVISVVAVTAIITPLIRSLYDPSTQQFPIKRRTIQQAKPGAELRVLVCIHNQENVPTIVNLLEASCATEEGPVAVIAVLLVELVGRAAPMLIAHQPHYTAEPNASASRSGHIINALRQYELYNEGCVTVRSFSAISQLETIHEDICRVAFDQNATIVIIPFHKYWAIDGSIGSVNRAIQNMNSKVLDRIPCSVGILIDRGILNGSMSIINSQSEYRVAVLYIGGPDDAESLSYGARMVNHNNVTLTVIRFLLFGSDNARERKLDTDLINAVRHANAGNEAFSYQEEVVRDGVGLATCIRALENCFDLILVGRQHQASTLLQGLGEWIECPELGVMGDFLASSDFGSAASVLVVQQQRVLGGRMMNRGMKPVVNDREMPLHLPGMQSHGGVTETTAGDNGVTWPISMDRI
ncbi:cation/H(+) antiporter 15-like [Actinidia eriantha]|uniref:cation/H(+) antiporter 15-like n=1 Tax=Actinidia eriantha TaxID=165200 RepID=UPI00258B1BAA|nr:cation/H(+) antiporter 15-like [Actinidia eriantha]